MSMIVGATVGTPTSPSKMEEELKPVKTVNGITPDENGNVELPGGGGGSGEPGADGFSPIATVTQTASGAVVSITDKNGTTTATIVNGKDGAKGDKGDKGDKGEKGETGAQGIQGIQGIQGEPGAKGDKGDAGAQGNPGKDGANGKDGVSATHSWNGTTLTITSASGTSSADLKGAPGKDGNPGKDGSAGADGKDGQRGTGLLPITTAPSSYTTTTGGFTPVYRIALSTVLTQSKVAQVLVGDMLAYSYYHYPVGYVDASYVYLGTRRNIRGATGSAGAAGKTPVKGTDYYTEADKAEMVEAVIAALPDASEVSY